MWEISNRPVTIFILLIFSDIVEEVKDDDEVNIKDILADMPARRHLQGMNSHNSKYGCSYCKKAAVTRGGTQWPFTRKKAAPRTTEESRYYARFVATLYWNCYSSPTGHCMIFRMNPQAPDDERRGVVADSALYDLENFNIIWQIPIDVFHLCFEGITKQMLKRMFVSHNTVESRGILAETSFLYRKMRVLTEIARRTRALKIPELKGSELCLITLTLLPTMAFQVIRLDHWCGPVAILMQIIHLYL